MRNIAILALAGSVIGLLAQPAAAQNLLSETATAKSPTTMSALSAPGTSDFAALNGPGVNTSLSYRLDSGNPTLSVAEPETTMNAAQAHTAAPLK
jgi:hypothetical protein